MKAVPVMAMLLALGGCEREQRPTHAPPPASGIGSPSRPAGAVAGAENRYEENAYAVSQGKTWYRAYNCNGCHAQGGGDVGPALMDAEWRYGAEPASIYATIAYGRPNGMPAFGGRVPEDQIWQLVAYVRSLSGQLPSTVAPSRGDTLAGPKPEARRSKEKIRPEPPANPGELR
jgi:cytochrome c oxidase cbb3-type subunit 3